jgi:hypothetical protein
MVLTRLLSSVFGSLAFFFNPDERLFYFGVQSFFFIFALWTGKPSKRGRGHGFERFHCAKPLTMNGLVG